MSKALPHKRQHWIPRSYLNAWCDPATPKEHQPYVWRFEKDGTSRARKSPKNIFHATDLYTIHLSDGTRELSIEHGLSELESEFNCRTRFHADEYFIVNREETKPIWFDERRPSRDVTDAVGD